MKVELFRQPRRYDACSFYRLEEPARVLTAMGHDVTVRSGGLPIEFKVQGLGARDRPVGAHSDADVLVFARLMDRETVECIPDLQRLGYAIVIEVDDDFHALPKDHPAKRDTAPTTNPDMNRRWLAKACELADLVTVTTPALARRYGSHGRVAVLPNYVPAWYLDVDAKHDLDIGWTGNTRNHVGDLYECGDAVRTVIESLGVSFTHIGPVDNTGMQLHIGCVHTGTVELADYPAWYGHLKVAIAPLASNEFNEAKSWLKMLEAAALGVPCIGSPTQPYTMAALNGLGVTVGSTDEWAKQITRLLELPDPGRRGEQARDAASRFTYEEHAPKWWDTWGLALEHRKANA